MILTVDGGCEGYDGKVGLCTEFIKDLSIDDVSTAVAIVVGPPMMMKFTLIELLKRSSWKRTSGFLMSGRCAAVSVSAATAG